MADLDNSVEIELTTLCGVSVDNLDKATVDEYLARMPELRHIIEDLRAEEPREIDYFSDKSFHEDYAAWGQDVRQWETFAAELEDGLRILKEKLSTRPSVVKVDGTVVYTYEPFFLECLDDYGKIWTFRAGDEDNLDTILSNADESVFTTILMSDLSLMKDKLSNKLSDMGAIKAEHSDAVRNAWNDELREFNHFESVFFRNLRDLKEKRAREDSDKKFNGIPPEYYEWESDNLRGIKFTRYDWLPDSASLVSNTALSALESTRAEFASVKEERMRAAKALMPVRSSFFSTQNYQMALDTWQSDYSELILWLHKLSHYFDKLVSLKSTGQEPSVNPSDEYTPIEIEWNPLNASVPIYRVGERIDSRALTAYTAEFLQSFDFKAIEEEYATKIRANVPESPGENGKNVDVWRHNLKQNANFWAEVREAVVNAIARKFAEQNSGYKWVDYEFSYVYGGSLIKINDYDEIPSPIEFRSKPYGELMKIRDAVIVTRNEKMSEVNSQPGNDAYTLKTKEDNKAILDRFYSTIQRNGFAATRYQDANGKVDDPDNIGIDVVAVWNISINDKSLSFESGKPIDFEKLTAFSADELETLKTDILWLESDDETKLVDAVPKPQNYGDRDKYESAMKAWDACYDSVMKFWKDAREATDIAKQIVDAQSKAQSKAAKHFSEIEPFSVFAKTSKTEIEWEVESLFSGLGEDVSQIVGKERELIDSHKIWRESMIASRPRRESYDSQEIYDRELKEWGNKFNAGLKTLEIARAKIDTIVNPILPGNAQFAIAKIDRLQERKYGEEKAGTLREETIKYVGTHRKPLTMEYKTMETVAAWKRSAANKATRAANKGNFVESAKWARERDRLHNELELDWKLKLAHAKLDALNESVDREDWSNPITKKRALEKLQALFPPKGGVGFYSDSYRDKVITTSKSVGFEEPGRNALKFLDIVAESYNTGNKPFVEPRNFRMGSMPDAYGQYFPEYKSVAMSDEFGGSYSNSAAQYRNQFTGTTIHEHIHNLVIANLGSNRENANIEWIKTHQQSEIKTKRENRKTKYYVPCKNNPNLCWREYSYSTYAEGRKAPGMPGTDATYRATEVITTGMQALALDPESFIRNCPLHFDLLLDNLRELQ